MKNILFAIVSLAVSAAFAGVFPVEPVGTCPVAKDGLRVYMGGNLNGMNEYFATYLYSWIYSSSEVKHFKFFKRFNGSHSYDNAREMPTTLKNVRPDVVIMVLGVDALYYGMEEPRFSEFKANWKSMADACAKAGTQLVLFSLPAKCGTTPEDAANKKLAAYADALAAFAKERGLCFFDLHRASFSFVKEQPTAGLNDLRMAKFLMDFFGLKTDYPHITADFAADTAAIEAPNAIVVKGKGQYEVTCPRPPLGFNYCNKEGADYTGLGLKVANLPADCDEVKLVWTGHSVTVKRAELEAGVNLEAVSPGWSPFRDFGMSTLKSSTPFWNQMVLTSRFSSFEDKVKKMEKGRDRTAFFDTLRRDIYEGVDRTFDENEAKCASYARDPVKFTLTVTPVKKAK